MKNQEGPNKAGQIGNAAANEMQHFKKIYTRKNDVNSFHALLSSAFFPEEIWALARQLKECCYPEPHLCGNQCNQSIAAMQST